MSECLFRSDLAEVWHGDSLDPADVAAVMGERKADLLCFDAPFSEKTHTGHANGKMTADRAMAYAIRGSGKRARERNYNARRALQGGSGRRDLNYEAFDTGKIARFCALWLPLCSGWVVSITDDVLAPSWLAAFEQHGLYRFAPVPLIERGSRCRMSGDGPSNWTCWLCVARPRTRAFFAWGTLPGAYIQMPERDHNCLNKGERVVGGKPVESMRAIVRDYSRAGDLVVDPFAGGGTTCLSARMEGRRTIGIDSMAEHANLTARRVSGATETETQGALFG